MAVAAAVLALLQSTGLWTVLDGVLWDGHYNVRGERATDQPVVVVEFDENVVDQRGIPPWEGEALHRSVERIAADGADRVAVDAAAGLAVGDAVGEAECSDQIIYYGRHRPGWVPSQCEWWPLSADERRPAPVQQVLDDQGRRMLVGLLADEADGVLPREVAINFTGGIPRISAANLVGEEFPEGLFRGRTVVVITNVEGMVDRASTPFGEVPVEVLRAEAVATLRDGAGLVRPAGALYLALLIGLLLGVVSALRSPPWLWAVGAAAVGLVLMHLAFRFGVIVGGINYLFGIGIGLLIIKGVAVERREQGREVQALLANAIKEAGARRTDAVADGDAFWSSLLERADEAIDTAAMSLAELPDNSWWFEFRAHRNLTSEQITERRRDVRRAPYDKPFDKSEPVVVEDYVDDESLSTMVVPLTFKERFLGFWMIHDRRSAAMLARNRAIILRVATQLAGEIHWRWLKRDAPALMDQTVRRIDDIVGASLAAMEHLEVDRQVLEDVSENARVGLMLADVFGDVTYENSVMRRLLEDAERSGKSSTSLGGLLAHLTGDDEGHIDERLDEVLDAGEPLTYRVTVSESPERHVELRICAVRRHEGRQNMVRGMLMTAVDITSAVESDRQKLETIRVVNTRAADLLNVVSGYTEVLAMSDGLEASEKALVEGLEEAIGDLTELIEDFEQVLDPSEASSSADETLPLSAQYTVREALRAASDRSSTGGLPVDLDAPDEPVIAQGHPESIQKALRLMIEDSAGMVPHELELKVSVREVDGATKIDVHVPDVMIPNSLLQRLLHEESAQADGLAAPGSMGQATSTESASRLYKARLFVEGSGGTLTAESRDGGLHYEITLPGAQE